MTLDTLAHSQPHDGTSISSMASASSTGSTSMSMSTNAPPKERDERQDKLLAAKKKLKSYRAKQNKAHSNTSTTPGSPSSPSKSATSASSKRNSFISTSSPKSSATTPLSNSPLWSSSHNTNSSTTIAGTGGKIAHGHAHRRSHSRNNLSISSRGSALLATPSSSSTSPRETAKSINEKREARRASLILARHAVDASVVAAACVNAATGSASANTASLIAGGSPSQSQLSMFAQQQQQQGYSSPSSSANATSSMNINMNSEKEQPPLSMTNRRNSRRHSRTSSISISLAPASFDGFATVSPSGVSPRKLSYSQQLASSSSSNSPAGNNLPSSSSSPSLSASLASFSMNNSSSSSHGGPSSTGMVFGGSASSNATKRQSVPAFASAAQHTLQNGRIVLSAQQNGISPHSSPNPPSQHQFGASLSSSSNNMFSNSNMNGAGGMLAPSSATGLGRRASLGVPKSPSFFESQQLASASASASSSASVTPSSATFNENANSSGHARKPSKHSRRTSVSTRRESMEIMAGVLPSFLASTSSAAANNASAVSPNPNHSAFPSSSDMSRLNTNATASTSSSTEKAMFDIASLAMEERSSSSSSEEERDFALSRLEGRLNVRPDIITLPGSDNTSATPAAAPSVDSMSSGNGSTSMNSRSEKRNSWNPRDSWGTSSPFALSYAGNKAGNLDMLIEEEEEEEENNEEARVATPTPQSQFLPDVEQNDVENEQESSSPAKRSRPASLAPTFPSSQSLSLGDDLKSPSEKEGSNKSISPPAASQSFAGNSHSSVKIGGGLQRVPPRPLSLMSSSSSLANLSSFSIHNNGTSAGNTSAEIKSARRQSGLRSLTLTSPEHVLNAPTSASSSNSGTSASPAPLTSATLARKRQSLLLNNVSSPASSVSGAGNTSANSTGGIRPFSISSTSSILSPDASTRSFQFGGHHSTTVKDVSSQGSINGLPQRARKSFSTASNTSVASSSTASVSITPQRNAGSSAPPSTGRPSLLHANTSGSINTASFSSSSSSSKFSNSYGGRRFSDLASPSSFGGFGDLVMEESLVEEDESEEQEGQLGSRDDEKILDGLNAVEEDDDHTQKLAMLSPEAAELSRADSSMSNVSVSDDPVILDLQVRALKSQVEHLRTQVSTVESAKKAEVDSLRMELSEVKEEMLNSEEEREMLREDIDGWRTRCADLERALQNERAKLDDERREGMLLRDKVRRLGDRLAAQQGAGPSDEGRVSSPDGGIDANLVNAQAKLIGEMRDQIFSLAAALERERLRNAGETEQDPSRSSSPLLRALASQDEKIAAGGQDVNRPVHHNNSTQSSAASGSYNFSSSFSSIHSQMGNNTEDTSIADDNESQYGSKSPSSPAFWASSPTPSYSSTSNAGGISIHTNMPLRNSDLCLNYGGLQTLTEEDEEEMEEEENTGEIAEVNAQAKKALSFSDSSEEGEEENDAVPELVHDEALAQRRQDYEALRARTQSASTGSSVDTNDRMPVTPVKEHGSPNIQPLRAPGENASQHQSKPSHHRSDSFITQWSFPKGPVQPLDLTQHRHDDSFWALYDGSLPPLPLSNSLVNPPPFSAEIMLDEEYFKMAVEQPLPPSRPASTISNASRPPTSRSTSYNQRLNSEIAQPAPSLSPAGVSPPGGSRLSLQGFSSLWGNYMKTPQTPPIPEETVSSFSSTSSKTASQPPSATKTPTQPSSGRKPLLRLQASPIGNISFAHSASCCTDSSGRGNRILVI